MKALNRNLFFVTTILVLLFSSCKQKQSAAGGKQDGGFMGKKKMLVGVNITSVQVVTWPRYTRDGSAWDSYAPLATDPDLYVKLSWTDKVLYHSETKEDCVFGYPQTFVASLPAAVVPFDQLLLLEIFDEDGLTADDNVAYLQWNVKDYEKQEVVELKNSTSDLVLRLGMEWRYE